MCALYRRPLVSDSAHSLHQLCINGKALTPAKPRHPCRHPSTTRPRRCSRRSPQRQRRPLTLCAAGGDAAHQLPTSRSALTFKARWSSLTQQLTAVSSLPFLLLLLPQLIKNAQIMTTNPSSLSIISWMGATTGLFGNTLLLQYFTTKGESSAVLVQAIGIASSFALLTQIRIAGCMPRVAYSAIAAVVTTTALITVLKLRGCLESKQGQRVWSAWQKVLGLAGLAVVPQVLWSTFSGTTSLLPSLITLGAACTALAMDSAGKLPPGLRNVWGMLSAWTATLLFMLQPVAQLWKNFSDPSSLAGLSLATIALAACGNALMVPRALFTRDRIWAVGSLWGCLLFGWGQMLSMWLGISAAGARYCSTPLFVATTAVLAAWFAFVLWADARAKRGGADVKPAS